MDNTSQWAHAVCFNHNISNSSDDETARDVFLRSLPTFVISVMGLPANLLVIVVYVHNMTTSTRVYMFALAVADFVSCSCGIILTRAPINFILVQMVIFVSDVSIAVSCVLLAFISLERLIAVSRPHKFSLNASRAKKALMVIFLTTIAVKTPLTLAYLFHYRLFHVIVAFCVIFTSIIIMTVSYLLMAVVLLRKARASRVRIGVHVDLPLRQPEASTSRTADATTSGPAKSTAAYSAQSTSKQVKAYKDVGLLFTITTVFVLCWIPKWLTYFKMAISKDVTHIFILNSLVNPFIYSIVSAMFRRDVCQLYSKIVARLTYCYR